MDLAGWSGKLPVWSVENGTIRGHAPVHTNYMRTRAAYEGDYTVVFEARVVADIGDEPLLSFSWGLRGIYEHFCMSFFADRCRLTQFCGSDQDLKTHKIVDYYQIPGGLDRKRWNTYRVVVKDDVVTTFVNGQELASHEGQPGTFDGAIAITVQQSTIEVRRVALYR